MPIGRIKKARSSSVAPYTKSLNHAFVITMGNFFHGSMCIMYAVIMHLCNVYVYKLLGVGVKRCLKLALNMWFRIRYCVYMQFRYIYSL